MVDPAVSRRHSQGLDLFVEAFAVNHRGSIIASDAATDYDELVITIAETD